MRIHHLSCVSACPLGGAWMDGVSRHSLRGRLTTHCLLLETDDSLVLVDTGYGLRDVRDPRSRLSKSFLAMQARSARGDDRVRQIEQLGLDPATFGHRAVSPRLRPRRRSGRLSACHRALDGGRGEGGHRAAYPHRSDALSTGAMGTRAAWQTYTQSAGEPWFGFNSVRGLNGIENDVLMVPLIGHTFGHAGIAVQTEQGWL